MDHVVIVEDEDIIRRGLMYSVPWLALGCTVVAEARNGVEGMEAIRQHSPDIVVADIDMPIMDGLDMIRETYQEYEYAAIILSGYSTFEYAQKAIRYGVLEYLLKPLDMREIEDAVRKAQRELQVRSAYLEKQKSGEELGRLTLFHGPPEGTGDDPVVREMLNYIKENYGDKILLRDVALRLNYSETYLNRKFKEITGTTFIEYLNRYRIQRSLDMIREGELKIQDISWKCGVGEYKYFNIVFKKYIGCTPKEYAAMIKNSKRN